MDMSAIAGVLGLPADERILSLLLKTMTMRGADGDGKYCSYDCSLLHTNMITSYGGSCKQPIELEYNGTPYTLVCDGELYNYREMRSQLQMLGHTFRDTSDAEVLLHAFAQWGERFLEKVNGVFGVAIWNQRKKELFLARDRMGVRPVFYKLHEGGFLFASEIKTILAYPTVRAELDADGAAELILLGPGRTPGSGVLRGIQELEPGCYGRYKDGKWSVRRYWQLRDRMHMESVEETAETVRDLVQDAIRRQRIAEPPVGTFLSGGLDSSIVATVCANCGCDEEQLQTFSLDYCDNEQHFIAERFQPDMDNSYIRVMNQFLNTQSHWTVLSTQSLFDALQEATIARDLPGLADVDSSLLLFCRDIAKHVKIALSGECADEIFGGYPWFRDPAVRDADGFPWAQNTKYRASFLLPWVRERVDPFAFINDRYLQTIRECDVLPETSPQDRRMKQMTNLNHRWFMQTLLDRNDRMSTRSGLAVRVPFCDYRIAEYMYAVPWEFKDYQGREKGLLRFAMGDLLPPEILNRKKSPYPKTYDPGYLDAVQCAMECVLDDPHAPIFEIIRRESIAELTTAEYSWPWYGQLMRVPQTIAYMLQLNFWLKAYQVQMV